VVNRVCKLIDFEVHRPSSVAIAIEKQVRDLRFPIWFRTDWQQQNTYCTLNVSEAENEGLVDVQVEVTCGRQTVDSFWDREGRRRS
jgi:hypothetical protein